MRPSAPGAEPRRAAGLQRLAAAGRAAAARLLDALLPPRCLTCEAEVAVQGTQCPACFAGLSVITEPFCARCGVPFAHEAQAAERGPAGAVCPACAAHPPAFAAARAALRYDAAAKRLILPFKHGDRTELARPLARHMARAGAGLLARADAIAPVPAHWRRVIARRYDQAALLAAELGRLGGRPVLPDLLRRARRTPPLNERGAAERALTVAGAFAVHPARLRAVRGGRVLLVDDVLTSGATANACAEALLAAGVASVDVLAAARVPDPRLRNDGAA
jgi:ComF family protein